MLRFFVKRLLYDLFFCEVVLYDLLFMTETWVAFKWSLPSQYQSGSVRVMVPDKIICMGKDNSVLLTDSGGERRVWLAAR